ncbi:MAG: phosphoglucosamine mutase [Desulfobacterales bacterium]
MAKLFGTDGIRGKAGRYPIVPDVALNIGRAAVEFCGDGTAGKPMVLIGRDPRISGDMLVHALAAGISQAGGQAALLGILPTPAISCLTRRLGASCGIVVSASHNVYEDNGIKLFGADGCKLSDELEEAIEERILNGGFKENAEFGGVVFRDDADGEYLAFLREAVNLSNGSFPRRLVVDCANGAASTVAKRVFSGFDLDALIINDEPDGKNINRGCGSQHPKNLARRVVEEKADAGFALDGDADRLIAVDESGEILSGDRILAILARHLKRSGRLARHLVVSTVMSNAGLTKSLIEAGIRHVTTRVGDRWVMEAMRENGAVLGGEDSGHIIFAGPHTTGDGLLTALLLIEAMRQSGEPLSRLKRVMTPFPQVLINVPVREKPPLDAPGPIRDAIVAVEHELGTEGRVLVRYSGTESLCRVMVEGPTEERTRILCERLARAVSRAIG